MNAKTFFDTNVLIYAFAQNDPRAERAEALLAAGGIVIVLNEFVAVATRKLGMPWKDVLEALPAIRVLCPVPLPLTVETHEAALRLSGDDWYIPLNNALAYLTAQGGGRLVVPKRVASYDCTVTAVVQITYLLQRPIEVPILRRGRAYKVCRTVRD